MHAHALRHLLRVMLYLAIFLLGKLMVDRRGKLAASLTPGSSSSEPLNRFFLYSGRTIKTVSAVAGFLEAVAALVLFF